MIPLQHCVPSALVELLKTQPLSPGKVSVAWQVAVGANLARASQVELTDTGILEVSAADERWARELTRSRDLLQARLESFLGPGVVSKVVVRRHRLGRPG